jgi:hypothetical protein
MTGCSVIESEKFFLAAISVRIGTGDRGETPACRVEFASAPHDLLGHTPPSDEKTRPTIPPSDYQPSSDFVR